MKDEKIQLTRQERRALWRAVGVMITLGTLYLVGEIELVLIGVGVLFLFAFMRLAWFFAKVIGKMIGLEEAVREVREEIAQKPSVGA